MSLRGRLFRWVVSQFGYPRGLGGRLAGWVMASRSSNRRRNAWVVELLCVGSTDRVLEIGFGPGLAIRHLAKRATAGRVMGVDHSPLMVRQATHRNRRAIRAGTVELHQASVDTLPPFDDPFDAILAVNSVGFWSDPDAQLCDLVALLRPGGTIAVASQPRCPGATAETSTRAASEIQAQLHRAGLVHLHGETLGLDPPVVCVIGRRPETSTGRDGPCWTPS